MQPDLAALIAERFPPEAIAAEALPAEPLWAAPRPARPARRLTAEDRVNGDHLMAELLEAERGYQTRNPALHARNVADARRRKGPGRVTVGG